MVRPLQLFPGELFVTVAFTIRSTFVLLFPFMLLLTIAPKFSAGTRASYSLRSLSLNNAEPVQWWLIGVTSQVALVLNVASTTRGSRLLKLCSGNSHFWPLNPALLPKMQATAWRHVSHICAWHLSPALSECSVIFYHLRLRFADLLLGLVTSWPFG